MQRRASEGRVMSEGRASEVQKGLRGFKRPSKLLNLIIFEAFWVRGEVGYMEVYVGI